MVTNILIDACTCDTLFFIGWCINLPLYFMKKRMAMVLIHYLKRRVSSLLAHSFLVFAVPALLAGCGPAVEQVPGRGPDSVVRDGAESKEAPVRRGRIVPHPGQWAMWLQGAQPDVVAASATDLVVVDYSADGTDAAAFTPQQIARMQQGGRKVLCYFSIGEAESYRFYWDARWKESPPPFLGPENPDWPENYKVRYWHEQWWDLVLRPYMDKILAAGFDGVYLDIVDAYWFWYEQGRDLQLCADDMIRLVARIANYMRTAGGPDFIISPQNAEGIFNDASEASVARYLEVMDMIGVESLLFNVTPEDSAYRTTMLRKVADAGKTVLNIEYIPLDRMAEYRKALTTLPFAPVPYRAEPDRALDSLAPQIP